MIMYSWCFCVHIGHEVFETLFSRDVQPHITGTEAALLKPEATAHSSLNGLGQLRATLLWPQEVDT